MNASAPQNSNAAAACGALGAGLTVRLLSGKSRPGGEEPRESPSVP